MDLSPLIGNESLKSRLQSGAGAEGLSHAYVISGVPGSGRHTLARILVGAVMCVDVEAIRPCTRCAPCKKVAAVVHPDVVTLAGEDGKPIAVDQVRQMRADAYIRPNEGRRKVYLLEDADRMNPSAQNALLKLLEDGPEYAMFLLLTRQPGGLLATVRSRCQELVLTPLDDETCRAALAVRFPQRSGEELDWACRQCQGVLGRGIFLLEGETEHDQQLRRQARQLARAMAGEDELTLFETAMPLESMKREMLIPFLDRLLAQVGEDLPTSANPRRLLRGAGLVKELRDGAERNANPGQLAGLLCAQMFSQ